MTLKEYKSKRNFEKTSEPRPEVRRLQDNQLVFVVHKHAARSLHYDLRLEMDGVLKSWAVPKGPSLDSAIKRLAVMVEDHPLDYKDFEGVIPEGNYGAGSVIVWDRGTYYHPSAKDREESEKLLFDGLKSGNIKLILDGKKLKGEFALVRTGMGKNTWLLLKKKDRHAGKEDILRENRSVVSGKTLENISESGFEKFFREKKISQIRLHEVLENEELKDAPLKPLFHNIKPMLATLIKEPFDHSDWLFEVKWDGYRTIAEINEGEVSLYSRNLLSLNHKFSPVVDALKNLRFDAVLDGEIVVVDDQGRPDFQSLQNYLKTRSGYLIYYVFDILYFHGHDLTNLPLIRRKELLKKMLPVGPKILFSDYIEKDGVLFFNAAMEKGLEGVMAKHSQSPYRVGRRSRQWLKIKTHLTQDAVIAGFTEPRGGRRYFGSLVLGAYEGGELIYIGHSGGGFGAKVLNEIHEKLKPLVRKKCPFKIEPDTDMPVTWVKPELVCEVAFSGWTDDGLMRQPVFLRMREDKSATEAVLEKDHSISFGNHGI